MTSEEKNNPSLQHTSELTAATSPVADTGVQEKSFSVRIFRTQFGTFLAIFVTAGILSCFFNFVQGIVPSLLLFFLVSFIFDKNGNALEGSVIRKTVGKIFIALIILAILAAGVWAFLFLGSGSKW